MHDCVRVHETMHLKSVCKNVLFGLEGELKRAKKNAHLLSTPTS